MEKGKSGVCYSLENYFSSFGVPGSSSQMMVDGIILEQIILGSHTFSSLKRNNLLVVEEPSLKDLKPFWYTF